MFKLRTYLSLRIHQGSGCVSYCVSDHDHSLLFLCEGAFNLLLAIRERRSWSIIVFHQSYTLWIEAFTFFESVKRVQLKVTYSIRNTIYNGLAAKARHLLINLGCQFILCIWIWHGSFKGNTFSWCFCRFFHRVVCNMRYCTFITFFSDLSLVSVSLLFSTRELTRRSCKNLTLRGTSAGNQSGPLTIRWPNHSNFRKCKGLVTQRSIRDKWRTVSR